MSKMITMAFGLAALAALGGLAHANDGTKVETQGRWNYSREVAPDDVIDMAVNPATQGADVSLLLACSGSGQLSVALMHADYFPFELDQSSTLQLQSGNLSVVSAVAERARTAQIVFDPAVVQQVVSVLAEGQELAVSVRAKGGTAHRYTFALQPNDVALAPLRSRCSGD